MTSPQSRLTRWATRLVYLQRIPVVGAAARVLLWLMGIDIPAAVAIAPGLRLNHPSAGLVVHPSTRIGRNVTLFHGVTLGRSDAWHAESAAKPTGGIVLGAGAVIGAGAVVLFRRGETVVIGDGAIIGANAVVNRDVPAGEIWAGNPASRVKVR